MDFFTFLFLDTTIPQIIPFFSKSMKIKVKKKVSLCQYFKGLLLFTQQEIRRIDIINSWKYNELFQKNLGHYGVTH